MSNYYPGYEENECPDSLCTNYKTNKCLSCSRNIETFDFCTMPPTKCPWGFYGCKHEEVSCPNLAPSFFGHCKNYEREDS